MNPKLWLAGKAASVAVQIGREKLTRPVARTSRDVPVSGARVSRQWLTEVLCRDTPGAEVLSFTTPGGSSGSSERVALRVTYNDIGTHAGLPTALFTKATASFRQRMLQGGAGVLAGETRYYMDFRPHTDMEAPYGHWAATDPASWRSITVLEDIVESKGARFVEPTDPLTGDQVRDLVQNLARYHGPFWNNPAIKDLRTPRDYIASASDFLDIRRRCEVGMQRAQSVIPPALLGQSDRIFEATVRAVAVASQQPRTLLHGDPHVGQTYITGEGRMGLTDWQCTMQGSWAFDYAYLVNSACEPEDRRAWGSDLLRLYLDALVEHGGPALDFDDAWLAYRQQAFWPYTAWAFTIGRAAYQPEMQPVATCLAIITRTAAALADLDALDAV